MIIGPRVRGFVCTTAHPTGCRANVRGQIDFVRRRDPIASGPKNVLVVGASAGYGLACRIVSAFSCGAATTGVFLERPPSEKRPATAGWYNTAAFESIARTAGLHSRSINGDAYSDAIKETTVDLLKRTTGPVDLLVYSLASPIRTHPKSGQTHRSVLKPIDAVYRGKTLDTDRALVKDIEIEPATPAELDDTVAVMGGEDWRMWFEALDAEGLVAGAFRTVSFTYLGPRLTWPIYRDGTIGRAKADLESTARLIGERLADRSGRADIAAMKALVTQASSAIPVVPLYISLLYRIMKERGTHEGCIEQVYRMLSRNYYGPDNLGVDDAGRIRMDDREMDPDVQQLIDEIWPNITTDNLRETTDFDGYQAEFLRLFGFGIGGIDYDADIDPVVAFDDAAEA